MVALYVKHLAVFSCVVLLIKLGLHSDMTLPMNSFKIAGFVTSMYFYCTLHFMVLFFFFFMDLAVLLIQFLGRNDTIWQHTKTDFTCLIGRIRVSLKAASACNIIWKLFFIFPRNWQAAFSRVDLAISSLVCCKIHFSAPCSYAMAHL